MSVFDRHFPLGLDTERFHINGPQDTAGIDSAVQTAVQALERGVDYIDLSYTYSSGQAMTVIREALRQTNKPVSIAAKVMYGMDRSADDARRRIETYLSATGLERIAYFTCWSISSYEHFEKIMEKGGIYEGALRLKAEGLVEHICAHFIWGGGILRILDHGVFEGITVTCSLLNAISMRPVLDAALAKDVGVVAMDPLAGGIVTRNPDYFSFANGTQDEGNTIHAALRFAKAHPAVKVVLGEMHSVEEADDLAGVFAVDDPDLPEQRIGRVMSGITKLQDFCTGCDSCAGCPKEIPVSELMQARNMLLFHPEAAYNRNGPEELLYNLQIFRRLYYDAAWSPETADNPCDRCGRCEHFCTQRLNIMDAVADIYRRAEETFYSRSAHKARLAELLCGKGYKRVGLYPSGGFASLVMRLYQESFGEPEFQWILLNSDPKACGLTMNGLTVYGPPDIPQLDLDLILVVTYSHAKSILESLHPYEQQGIQLKPLHREAEMPWVF